MKISHKLCDRMDGTQLWNFPWFPANSLLCVVLFIQCKSCDILSLVEITSFTPESKPCKGFFWINFPPVRALEFITGHMVYNLAYTYILQTTTTKIIGFWIRYIYPHLLDPQSVFRWSKIFIALPQRSGLESLGHSVTVGKTILSKGKVSTTDFMGFSIQPVSLNFIYIRY